jgi:hypothetical protein
MNYSMKSLGPGPQFAAAVVDDASGWILKVLRGPCLSRRRRRAWELYDELRSTHRSM